MRIILCCLALLLLPIPAHTRAPQPPDPDPKIRAWFQSLRRDSDNFPCCSDADCRQVDEFRMEDGRYVVKARREDFVMDKFDAEVWDKRWPGQDEVWMTIPRGNITIRTDNPTGHAILCYSVRIHQIFCYVPWDWKY